MTDSAHRFEGARCVVLGGAGFIGGHLVDALLAEGAYVLVVDDFSTGVGRNLPEHPRLRVEPLDVTQDETGPKVLAHARAFPRELNAPSFVFNLASPASPAVYDSRRLDTLRANARGVETACELAARLRATLVQASTSEVYGQPEVHPQPESYWGHVNPIGPRSCYDVSKRYAEAFIAAFVRERGLLARIARIHNTYGPRMRLDDGRVVVSFLKALVHKEKLPILGDGMQTRCFCYVSDMVEGLLRLALCAEAGWQPVNLGSDEELTLLELADAVAKAVGGGSVFLHHNPGTQDDPLRRRPDLTRARKLIDWKTTVPLERGLQLTYADVLKRCRG